MQLNDFNKIEENKKLDRLTKVLRRDYGVDFSIYEALSYDEIEMFLGDLETKKFQMFSESQFNDCYQDQDYAKATLLAEALRILLKEISPKRTPKKLRPLVREGKEEVDETLDYKVHAPSGAAVDHDVDEDEERPDLYWRRHQWEEERTQDNLPVSAEDAAPAGQAYDTDWSANNATPEQLDQKYDKMAGYPENSQPVGGTQENEQQAGVYVAVMDPNRFLGDEGDQKVMTIEPVDKSGNDTSLLTRKVAPKMADVEETATGITEFEISGNTDAAKEGKNPSKIIAVYEDDEDEELTMEGLSEILEKSLLEEGELERAEIVLSHKDIVIKLQSMIEDLGKMGTDDIMPMVDGIRNNVSGDVAQRFSTEIEQKIQDAADGIQAFKNSMESYASQFEKRISDEDVETPINDMTDQLGSDMGTGMDDELPVGDELGGEPADAGADLEDELSGDALGGDDAAASEEPLGRAKKESRVVNLGGKKVKLTMEQIAHLATARKIMERVRTLGTSGIPAIITLNTVLDVHGKKVRLSEEQVKALLFAKNWRRLVESKKANAVRLSEDQAKKLMMAKKLTEKIKALTDGRAEPMAKKKAKGSK